MRPGMEVAFALSVLHFALQNRKGEQNRHVTNLHFSASFDKKWYWQLAQIKRQLKESFPFVHICSEWKES